MDMIERIRARLEAGNCKVHPHGGHGVEINLTYGSSGKESDLWVNRYNDFRKTVISGLGVKLSLSDEDAAKLDPIIDKLLYEERRERSWILMKRMDELERVG